MSGPRPSESRCFNENSPRPPVPGEERGGYQGRCQQALSSTTTSCQAQPDAPKLSQFIQTTRRASCDANDDATATPTTKTTTSVHIQGSNSSISSGGKAGYELEGSGGGGGEHHHYHHQQQQHRRGVMEISAKSRSDDKIVDNAANTNTSSSSSSSLACLQWTKSLRTLLEDQRGLDLFNYYLQQEGYDNVLSFWLACEGLMEERNPDKLPTIYKAIYRKFFQRPKLALLSESLRKEVTRRYREGHADKRMFEQAHQEVERLLEETPYPNFLRSELYLQYVRHCQSAERDAAIGRSSSSSSTLASKDMGDNVAVVNECSSSPDELSLSCASSLLPTLHEDSEFSQHAQHQHQHHHPHHQTHQQPQQPQQQHTSMGSGASTTSSHGSEMRLTKDMLMATQQYRALDVRPKPEAYAGLYLQPGASPYHASVPTKPRAQYCSYNPVSRQDSELQSLSSDARTESDNLSLTDASLSDSASMVRRTSTRKQYAKQYQMMKRSAMLNRDPMLQENFTPRTQKVTRDQLQPMPPEKFAEKLIEKLKLLQLDREKGERLDRKLRELDQSTSHADSICDSSSLSSVSTHHHHHHHYQQPQSLGSCMSVNSSGNVTGSSVASGMQSRPMADALCEKLLLEDDSDQAILDQHVSRVWSDLTPSRSPKLSSPRPRSPDKSRRQQQQQLPQQQHQQQMMHQQSQQLLHHHQQQQQQQQMSMSGATPRPMAYRSQRKEKDVFSTFSGDSGNVHDFPEAGELHAAGSMSSLGSHHLPKSKSVPSDYADSLHNQDLYLQGQDPRYRRLDGARSSATKKSLTELTDSGVSVVSDVPPSGFKETRRTMLNWPKPQPNASGKKFSNAPQHPFVGDPGMPLLPQPHTPTQLEEASRRLQYEKYENRSRQRGYPSSSVIKHDYEQPQQQQQQQLTTTTTTIQPATSSACMQSSQSTLRRGGRQDGPSEFTTVVFSFCEEKVPYRTKIAGYNVTLKQFKDVLPKKGSYRYFFKTECEDLDMQVIQEEITDDAEVLPLWEGKVMAQVKALE